MPKFVKDKDKQSLSRAVKNIFIFLRPWRREVSIGLFFFLFSAIIAAFIPFIYGNITDLVIQGGDIKLIVTLLAVWFAISSTQTIIRYFGQGLVNKVSLEASNEFIVDLFGHVINLPMSFHKEKKMGSIARKITNGADRGIYSFIERILFNVFPDLITFFVALVILMAVNWQLASVLVGASFVYTLASVSTIKKIIKGQKKIQKLWQKSYGYFFDTMSNIHNVKITNNESYERKRISKSFNKSKKSEVLWDLLWQKLSAIQNVIIDVNFIAVFTFGVFLLSRDKLTPGQLIMFIGYTSLLVRPLSQLVNHYRTLRQVAEHMNEATELYHIEPESTDTGTILDIKGDVKFKNISFAYPDNKKNVLKSINFSILAGQSVALVGKSGVGKTTLVDLIGNYYFPQRGTIKIDDLNTKSINIKSLRAQISVVPQEVSLFNDTILHNISYAKPGSSLEDVIRVSKLANAHEFISKFPKQYNQKVGERGIKLSTGQKQRIAIARAMLRNPKILILDEATSALDSESEKLVQEALDRLIQGKTTFIIAHRLSTIQNADKIIVLEKGSIAEMGTHQKLMRNPKGIYRNFWELQSAQDSQTAR